MLSEYGNHVIILCKLAIVSSSYLSTTLELLLPFLFQAHKKWASHRMLQQFLQNVIFDYQTNITSGMFLFFEFTYFYPDKERVSQR